MFGKGLLFVMINACFGLAYAEQGEIQFSGMLVNDTCMVSVSTTTLPSSSSVCLNVARQQIAAQKNGLGTVTLYRLPQAGYGQVIISYH